MMGFGSLARDLEAAFTQVMEEARRNPAFAERVMRALAELQAESRPAAPAPAAEPAPFDPYEPNLEVALMQNQDAAIRERLLGLSFAQLAKMVKAQRVANVRSLFGGVNGEPANKERIVEAMIESVRARIKSRFSAAR